ncbi:MAG: right-handed parallel beta-helix repeat-containing protein [Fibrobacterales bacterium]
MCFLKLLLKYSFLLIVVNLHAATYFVSSSKGHDFNDGLSENRPWQSIDRVNYVIQSKVLQPGDSILFYAGDEWHGRMLHIQYVNGEPGNPIVFSRYSTTIEGPSINGGFKDLPWVPFDSVNTPGVYSADIGLNNSVLKGIHDSSFLPTLGLGKFDLAGKYLGIYEIDSLEGERTFVEEVIVGKNVFGPMGYTDKIYVKTIDGEVPKYPEYQFFTNSLSMRYCQYVVIDGFHLTGGMDGAFVEGSHDIILRNNTIEKILGIGIKVAGGQHNWKVDASVNDITIENNTISNTGNNAIYSLYSDGLIVRGNDLSGVAYKPFGVEPTGDKCLTGYENCLNTVIEYNFAHDSKGCHFYDPRENYGDTVRYNVVYNAGGFGAFHGGDLTIHNNIFYSGSHENSGMGGAHVTSNLPINIYENIWVLNKQMTYTAGLHSHGPVGLRFSDSLKTGSVNFNKNVVIAEGENQFIIGNYEFPNTTSDSNCYFSNAKHYFIRDGVNYNNLDEFQLATVFDSSSVYIDPVHLFGDKRIFDWGVVGDSLPCSGAGIPSVEGMLPSAFFDVNLDSIIDFSNEKQGDTLEGNILINDGLGDDSDSIKTSSFFKIKEKSIQYPLTIFSIHGIRIGVFDSDSSIRGYLKMSSPAHPHYYYRSSNGVVDLFE